MNSYLEEVQVILIVFNILKIIDIKQHPAGYPVLGRKSISGPTHLHLPQNL